eukprot:COSAG02_NODE_13423_length_1397_cov_1.137904_3_plen_87_part_01
MNAVRCMEQRAELDAALAEMAAEMSASTKVLHAIVEGEQILAMRDRTSVQANTIPTMEAASLLAREMDEERQEERLTTEETAKELVG